MTFAETMRYILLTIIGTSMCFVLLDRKYSFKKTLWILGSAVVLVILLYMSIAALFGTRIALAFYPLVTNGTLLITLFFLSERKGFPVVFNMLTAINISALIILPGTWLTLVLGKSVWLDILTRLVISVPLVLFLYRHLRPSYLKMLTVLKKGWGYLCLIPLLFYVLFYMELLYFKPVDFRSAILSIAVALFIVAVSYGVIFTLFSKIVNEVELKEEQHLLKSQVQAMERQADMLTENKEQIRIYRHDMRHYLADVKILLESGNVEEALRVLGDFDEKNNNLKVPVYCENVTVNAILVYYIQKAEHEGIIAEADCRLSKQIPVEPAELAMVLANAIENAVHACQRIPKDRKRLIRIKIVSSPQLALEVANSYAGGIVFDEQGLPVSAEIGHGLGTKSIAAFVEKYDGVMEYSADDALFRLRLLVG